MHDHKHAGPAPNGSLSRRRFLGGAAAAAAFTIVPSHVLGGKPRRAPSEKLHVAGVGLGVMGCENLRNCGEDVVAVCDVDWTLAAEGFKRFPKAAKYEDYRRMLDKHRGIDAVIVATPDHTHAVITAEAIRRGKHVYTQAPLAHDVWEARQLTKLAREAGVVTQMGNERHSGPDIRKACEYVWSGTLGAVREVHCWTNRPRWAQGMARPKDTPPTPPKLRWDLWLGPAPKRPYHPAYHPCDWRGWVDFGTGALGAMGCHILDAPFWALKLDQADTFTVEASSTGTNGETWPKAATVRYRFGARGDMPPVTVTWFDGGRKPPRPPELPKTRRHVGSNGTFFIGEKCKMALGPVISGTRAGQAGPRLMPESLMASARPKQTIPRVKFDRTIWVQGSRHELEWITACKKGRQPCSSFATAGPLTEMVLLGNVALLAGKPIEWDRKKMTILNNPAANNYIRRPPRPGWTL